MVVACKLVNAVNVCLWFQEWNKNLGANQDPSSNSEGKVLFSVKVGCVSPLVFFVLDIVFQKRYYLSRKLIYFFAPSHILEVRLGAFFIVLIFLCFCGIKYMWLGSLPKA